MSDIQIACVTGAAPSARYWSRLSAFELQPSATPTTTKTLRRWRREAPTGARFITRVDPAVAASGFVGDEAAAAWEETLRRAAALDATWALLRTPASFRPTADNRRAIESFFAARQGALQVAWWAEGLWEGQPDELAESCDRAGLIPALDPLGRDLSEDPLPAGDRVYWRLMGRRGLSSRFTDHDLDVLTVLLGARQGGVVVFTSPEMRREAERFAQLLGWMGRGEEDAAPALDELDDAEDEDERGALSGEAASASREPG